MANEKTFHFELVSPERKLVSEPAHMVVIPGEEGDFGVMAGHMSLVATARTGVVKVFLDDAETLSREIFITGGFADVSAHNCSLLAEEAVNVDDLDAEELTDQIKGLQARLDQADDEADIRLLQRAIDLAKIKRSYAPNREAVAA